MTIAKSCSGRGMCALTTFLFQPTTCAVLASFLTRLRTPYQLFIGHLSYRLSAWHGLSTYQLACRPAITAYPHSPTFSTFLESTPFPKLAFVSSANVD